MIIGRLALLGDVTCRRYSSGAVNSTVTKHNVSPCLLAAICFLCGACAQARY